ncbi:mRNA splicing factor snRNPE (nucleomorph) [Bigelowiella natans]|uniref:mRNA splicing factor snRNPE n=1 Tax=Bigelowiella natans TaxID=227086 RepID=Q3LWL7_BIGNA|nr:mRNA splicing factor snRNPE [Bigelowiella natans]ABA27149.1 mRNA splicing factor snRNPE [Bigelowiella natans]
MQLLLMACFVFVSLSNLHLYNILFQCIVRQKILRVNQKIQLILYYKSGININSFLIYIKKLLINIDSSSNSLLHFQTIINDSDIEKIIPYLSISDTKTTKGIEKTKKYLLIHINEFNKKINYLLFNYCLNQFNKNDIIILQQYCLTHYYKYLNQINLLSYQHISKTNNKLNLLVFMVKKKMIIEEKIYEQVIKSEYFVDSCLKSNCFLLLKDDSNTYMKKNSYPFNFFKVSVLSLLSKNSIKSLIKLTQLLFLNSIIIFNRKSNRHLYLLLQIPLKYYFLHR